MLTLEETVAIRTPMPSLSSSTHNPMFLLSLQISLLMLHLLAPTITTPEVVENNIVTRAIIIRKITLTKIPLTIIKTTLTQITDKEISLLLGHEFLLRLPLGHNSHLGTHHHVHTLIIVGLFILFIFISTSQ